MPTDEQWQAIQSNDIQADTTFWYAVKTTGIFCRPSCKSRLPRRENVEIFTATEDAIQAGFRPCKRCRPLGQPVDNLEWVAEIDQILISHYAEPLTLDELAYLAHGSASYLRHVYQAETGQSPQQRLTKIRLEIAKSQLLTSNQPIAKMAIAVGFKSSAYFIQQFRQAFGQTPLQFRKSHQT